MSEQPKSGQFGLFARIISMVAAALLLILAGSALYTANFVSRAERRFPPSDFITVDGVQMHYHIAGAPDDPLVVIIHGGGGNTYDYLTSPLYDQLIEDYRLIIVDRPGLGYSERPNDEPSFAVQAELIHDTVEALGVGRAVLIGQSWGGGVAMTYAANHPETVAAIVMLGGHAYPVLDGESEPLFDTLYGIVLTPVIGDIVANTIFVPLAQAFVVPSLVSDATVVAPLDVLPQEFAESTVSIQLRPSHLKNTAWEYFNLEETLTSQVPLYDKVEAPIIYVVGETDTPSYEQYERFAADHPEVELVEVAKANHYLWFPFPEAVVEAVDRAWALAE